MAFWQKQRMLAQGAQAPDVEVSTLEGGTKKLRDLAASGPALLAFFKNTCPVCQFTLPFLNRLKDRVQVWAISQDNARDTREFLSEYGAEFPALLDGKGYPASNGFGITNVPSLFVVEPDGTISFAVTGFSKRDLEALAARFGVENLFRAEEYVPEWRAG